jgi:hypothetical protein
LGFSHPLANGLEMSERAWSTSRVPASALHWPEFAAQVVGSEVLEVEGRCHQLAFRSFRREHEKDPIAHPEWEFNPT